MTSIGLTMIIVFSVVMMLIQLLQGKPEEATVYRETANVLLGIPRSTYLLPPSALRR